MTCHPSRWAALLMAAAACAAFSTPAEAQRYLVHRYGASDGLPSPTVWGITQDSRGVMWFATRAGIASYDGARWRKYEANEKGLLPDFFQLEADDEGVVWSVSSTPPLMVSYFEDQKWGHLPLTGRYQAPEDLVVAMAVRRGPERRLAVFVVVRSGGLFRWDGQQWQQFSLGDAGLSVSGMVLVGDELWFSTSEGLFAKALDHPERDGHFVHGVPREELLGLAEESGGGTWILGADWVGRFEEGRLEERYRGRSFIGRNPQWLYSLEPDHRGGLFFGTARRFYHLHPGGELEHLSKSSGLAAPGATSLFRDREGDLWVGSLRGVSKLVSERFANFDAEQNLFGDEVTSILRLRSGDTVLGHMGGVTFWRGKRKIPLGPPDDELSRVLQLAEDQRGNVYAAANWGGLFRISPSGKITRVRVASGGEGAFSAVHLDRRGRVWTSRTGRLYRSRPGGFERVRLPLEREIDVRRFCSSRRGFYALTHRSGLVRIAEQGVERWRCSDGEACNSTFDALDRKNGETWVGTSAGLYDVRNGVLEPLDLGGRPFSRPVYLLVEDRQGRVWIGSDNGIERWDGDELRHFSPADGLSGTEANRDAGFVDEEGHVWLGTDGGLSIYREEYDTGGKVAPLVELESIEAGGRAWESGGRARIALGPSGGPVTFRVGARSFVDENRVRFRTWLEGFEPDWQQACALPSRELRYTSLPPGRYRFHLEALSADGVASPQVTSPWLIIRPPPWRRPEVLILGGLLSVLLVSGIVSWVNQRRYAARLRREVRDRTADLRSIQRKLEQEKERLAATLAGINDGVIAADGEGAIVLCNPAAEEILDRPAAELQGRRVEQLLPGIGEAGAIVIRRPNGERQWIEGSRARLPAGEGVGMGTVLAFRDVTARRRTEKELAKAQKLESLGLLAGGIAHDFNNLLTVIIGNLSLVEDRARESPVDQRAMADAHEACRHARSLTQQLLTFSKGGKPLREPSRLDEVVLQSTSLALSGTNVRSSVEIGPELWPVDINQGQIAQVLSNLLINASQAMQAGGDVWVRVRNLESEGGVPPAGRWVVIEVEDRGSGISPETADHIFDPFFSTKDGGSGLGLAIAHSIVTSHDGHITAESEAGKGATFRVFLPASVQSMSAAPVPAKVVPRGSGRILIMDDEPAVREVIERMLERLGYEPSAAADGEQALREYRKAMEADRGFRAVLMDLTIPGAMGGKQAVRELREIDPGAKVIVASGYSTDPVLAHYRDFGFDAAIEKPFQPGELAAKLAEVLG